MKGSELEAGSIVSIEFKNGEWIRDVTLTRLLDDAIEFETKRTVENVTSTVRMHIPYREIFSISWIVREEEVVP